MMKTFLIIGMFLVLSACATNLKPQITKTGIITIEGFEFANCNYAIKQKTMCGFTIQELYDASSIRIFNKLKFCGDAYCDWAENDTDNFIKFDLSTGEGAD